MSDYSRLKDSNLPEIYFATHNLHKCREVSSMLAGKFLVKNLNDLNLSEDIPETGATLEENSAIKARYLYNRFRLDCFADDSGLEVVSLDGAPGVLSARFAGEPKSDKRNIDLLLLKLQGITNRKARFRTVITLILDGVEKQFEGIVSGQITDEEKGMNGFGYDPIFIPNGYDTTFAEMSADDKNRISHRARAVEGLTDYLMTISSKG